MTIKEISKAGNPILRHQSRTNEIGLPDPSSCHGEAVIRHLEEYLGPAVSVFHEIVSDLVHLDVHFFAPTPKRPFITLVTTGMSDRPMSVSDEKAELKYAELMIDLPSDWRLDQDSLEREENYWPIRWLKTIARLPHEYDTCIGYGHTIPNGDPPKPFASNTKFVCMAVDVPVTLPDVEASKVEMPDGKIVHVLRLVPLYKEEVQFKLDEGFDALMERFEAEGVGAVVNLRRPNVVGAKKGFFARLFGGGSKDKVCPPQTIAELQPGACMDDELRAAATLMEQQSFDKAIAAYLQIAETNPDMRGVCLSQIGAAHYFKSEYEEAIRCYQEAMEHGADETMMRDNIQEAQEALKRD